jgi:hypothetical protein
LLKNTGEPDVFLLDFPVLARPRTLALTSAAAPSTCSPRCISGRAAGIIFPGATAHHHFPCKVNACLTSPPFRQRAATAPPYSNHPSRSSTDPPPTSRCTSSCRNPCAARRQSPVPARAKAAATSTRFPARALLPARFPSSTLTPAGPLAAAHYAQPRLHAHP